jgi:hypothetical protein
MVSHRQHREKNTILLLLSLAFLLIRQSTQRGEFILMTSVHHPLSKKNKIMESTSPQRRLRLVKQQ